MSGCNCAMLLVDVIPGIGMDDVLFGWTREQVEARVGPPEEAAEHAYEDGDHTVAWYYWSRGFSFHFDAEDDWRLSRVEVDAASARLNGLRVIGLSRQGLLEFLGAEQAAWTEEPDSGLVDVQEWGVSFWLKEGVVVSVQWGVLFSDDDEAIWPHDDV